MPVRVILIVNFYSWLGIGDRWIVNEWRWRLRLFMFGGDWPKIVLGGRELILFVLVLLINCASVQENALGWAFEALVAYV